MSSDGRVATDERTSWLIVLGIVALIAVVAVVAGRWPLAVLSAVMGVARLATLR